jgi:tartrate dehydratase beta subunit/fumarate hydratase class I family protein
VLPLVVLREVTLNSIPIKDVSFDDTATLAMGEAFDHACVSLHRFGKLITARELIAKRIIEAAKNGERDPTRLHEQSLIPFGIEDMSMLVVSVGRDPPVPTYASVTHPA